MCYITDAMNNELTAAPASSQDGFWTPPQEQERGAEYNPSQRLAIGSDAPVTVATAGPGSGKSHTIIGRILHGPAAPLKTLVVTYTTSAAKVLKRRLVEAGAEVFFAGTVHAFLFRLIRQYANKVGYSPHVGILDAEAADLLLVRVTEMHRFTGTYLQLEAELKRGPIPAPKTDPELVCSAYWAKLRESNVVDFATIIRLGTQLLNDTEVRQAFPADLSLCWDEAQDMANEYLAVFNSIPARWKFATGDPKQSIFSFLGANVANIMEVAAAGATVIQLAENYRCPESVCRVANALIAANPVHDETVSATGQQGRVELFDAGDEVKEAVMMAQKANALLAADPHCTIAVLVMTHDHRRQLEAFLEGHGVLVEKREDAMPPRDWKETRSLLNALSDPDNVLFCEDLVRAWKPTDANAIIKAAVASLQSLNDASLHLPYLSTAAEVVAFIEAKKPSPESVKRLRDALATLAENGESSIADLQIALAEQSEPKEVVQGGKVRVMTYWAAKGMEFDNVFLPALEETMMPPVSYTRTPALLEECRRVLYVGVTRAKKNLFLSWAGTRRPIHGKFLGKPQEQERSRFLTEMGFAP